MIGVDVYKIQLAARMVYNDGLTVLGLTPCRGEIFFIAGLPKSGSTWLYRLIGSVPGVNYRPARGPSGLNPSGFGVSLFDDVNDRVFMYHPRFGCSVFKNHTRYSPENWTVLKANGVT